MTITLGNNLIDNDVVHPRERAKLTFLAHYRSLERPDIVQKKKQFIAEFNAGKHPDLLNALGPTSFATAERWLGDLKEQGIVALRSRHQRGITLEDAERKAITKYLLSPNRLLYSEVVRYAREEVRSMEIEPKSERTYLRYINEFKEEHKDMYILAREGEKALNDTVMRYIERDLDAIEVGDIIFADGHTLNFEAYNPFTGKAKRMTMVLFYDMKSSMPLGCEIMPTENVMTIASALRKSIMMLGFMPRIVYLDNGRAFRSKYFRGVNDFEQTILPGLFDRLGINVMYAKPYHGQTKTVERFFKTFGEIERALPTYTGTSIALKPARMMRNEKLHRAVAGETKLPTIRDVFNIVQHFFADYAQREHVGGKQKGRSPIEIYEESITLIRSAEGFDKRTVGVAELNFLMMEEKITKIGRNGITFHGRQYFNEELYGKDKDVVIKFDLADEREVLIFDTNGNYICTAARTDLINPAARLLGNEEDQRKLSEATAMQSRLKKETKSGVMQVWNAPAVMTPSPIADTFPADTEPLLIERMHTEQTEIKRLADGTQENVPVIDRDDDVPLFQFECDKNERENLCNGSSVW